MKKVGQISPITTTDYAIHIWNFDMRTQLKNDTVQEHGKE